MDLFIKIMSVILVIGVPFVFGLCLGVTTSYVNFMRGVNKTLEQYQQASREKGYEPDGTDTSNVTFMKHHKNDKDGK